MELVLNMFDPLELVGFVRSLTFPTFTLQRILPETPISDTEFRGLVGNRVDVDAATYRTFDAESPIASRKGMTRISGAIPPISRKIQLGEEERLRLEALKGGNEEAAVKALFDDARDLIRAIQARLELARGEAITQGSIVLNENGVQATIDFDRDAALDFTPGGANWDNIAADILGDLRIARNTYRNINDGLDPGAMVMSSNVVARMVMNTAIRNLFASSVGAPSILTEQAVGQVLSAQSLPPIVTYDTQVRVDGVATRVIPDGVVVFVPPASEPLGDTFFGVTADAMELTERGVLQLSDAPGLVAVVEKTFDPPTKWTKASGLAIPFISNPDLTAKLTVYTP